MKIQELPKAYNPKDVEERIYQFWLDGGYFTPKIEPGKKPFVIIMPPPNVTGELHVGHALTATLEDIMVRWHRMKGEPTLWLPGTDHAGIATQVVVENALTKEGTTRHALGREKFLERVWQWVRQYGGIISQQHRKLGASCDWSRERFTLDPGPSLAVRTTFVNLFKKGLIYRGERIINWCPRCSTALSDLEVEHEEVSSHLYYIRYLIEGGGHITVATTRPETLLGDTAVAVNPADSRYTSLVGQTAILPALGRRIPVIADEAVEPSFGTGAVKVTPAHDPVDFEIAQRNNLPAVVVIALDGTMTPEAGPYRGMERFTCRQRLLQDLERDGLLEKTEPYAHSVGHCQRCRTVVEPLVSKQWFVKIQPLAQPAIKAIQDGRIKIIPERFTKVYLNWMEGIRDWCISRQLWWGHRIPVWYCADCDGLTVELEDPTVCFHCGSGQIDQDPDVLDTWFSSALWPHSTLGWPQQTEEMKYFYPTAVMETGYDILFFWVARMIMMGLENCGDVPFHAVYLHGLIRDERGQKMSKTRGNVLDPLDAIERYGTDALRFAVSTGTTPGNDSRLSSQKLEAGRNFANKLWNASRFVLGTLRNAPVSPGGLTPSKLHPEDRWILSRLNSTIQKVNQMLEEYQFGEAERELHDFLWGEFCDWYLEMAKIRLQQDSSNPSAIEVLPRVLEASLRLLHPFMPFITEEIWQRLVKAFPVQKDYPDSIIIAPYPVLDESSLNPQVEAEVSLVTEIIREIRNFRAEERLDPSKVVKVALFSERVTLEHLEGWYLAFLQGLARADVTLHDQKETRPANSRMRVVRNVEVHLLPTQLSSQEREAERRYLEKEVESYLQRIQKRRERLQNHDFTSRAPAEVMEREGQRLREEEGELAKVQARLAHLGSG